MQKEHREIFSSFSFSNPFFVPVLSPDNFGGDIETGDVRVVVHINMKMSCILGGVWNIPRIHNQGCI